MIVPYVLWQGLLAFLAFCGWVIGRLIGTFVGGMVAGFMRGYKG